jgi:hypothetical protein
MRKKRSFILTRVVVKAQVNGKDMKSFRGAWPLYRFEVHSEDRGLFEIRAAVIVQSFGCPPQVSVGA